MPLESYLHKRGVSCPVRSSHLQEEHDSRDDLNEKGNSPLHVAVDILAPVSDPCSDMA